MKQWVLVINKMKISCNKLELKIYVWRMEEIILHLIVILTVVLYRHKKELLVRKDVHVLKLSMSYGKTA